MLNLSSLEEKLSQFTNPFSEACVDQLHIHVYPNSPVSKVRASLEFKNGMTGGKQEFVGDSLPVVCQQIDDFVKGLKDA